MPHTVICSLWCFLTNLSNYFIASSLGVLSSIFIGWLGNFSKSSSNKGILLLLVSITKLSCPKASILFLNEGS